MPWQELTFSLSADRLTAFEEALMDCGALSVTLRDAGDQPILEPPVDAQPVWEQSLLTAMFEMDVDITDVFNNLKQQLALNSLPQNELTVLEDQEWRLSWRRYFKPMQFGQRLWICPSGYDHPAEKDAVVIDLDPGLAFGTGSHSTTALCLEWLDANPVKDKTVIDYGCGSGILAIAAARLGAKQVIAVDNDPQALQATSDNAVLNHVEERIQVFMPDDMPQVMVDVMVANILLEPLLKLEPVFATQLGSGTQLILSGILQDQADQLKAHYIKDFSFEACGQREEWVRLHAIRR